MIREGPLRRRGWSLATFATLFLAGCASFGSMAGEESVEEVQVPSAEVARLIEEEDVATASEELKGLASRCESGEAGREAVLALAALEIDARNPAAFPAAAAQLAARYLQYPSAPAVSVRVAESLYLLALDLGAAPVENPLGAIPTSPPDTASLPGDRLRPERGRSWRVAPRFQDCGSEEPVRRIRSLPEHPGMPLWMAMKGMWEERDSLSRRSELLERRADSLTSSTARLRQVRDSLETELGRIRELLRQGVDAPIEPERR